MRCYFFLLSFLFSFLGNIPVRAFVHKQWKPTCCMFIARRYPPGGEPKQNTCRALLGSRDKASMLTLANSNRYSKAAITNGWAWSQKGDRGDRISSRKRRRSSVDATRRTLSKRHRQGSHPAGHSWLSPFLFPKKLSKKNKKMGEREPPLAFACSHDEKALHGEEKRGRGVSETVPSARAFLAKALTTTCVSSLFGGTVDLR